MLLSEPLATIGGVTVLWYLLSLLWRCWSGFKLYFVSKFWQADLRRYGQWAVVTGATSGIGKAYAIELARRGLDVVLVGRSEDKLRTVAMEIEEVYGRKTHTIKVNFNDGHRIYPDIAQGLRDLEIGILVNNVGIIYSENFAYFLETPNAYENITNIVNCNMLSVPQMCRLVLPQMAKRRRGLIINISSEIGVRPHPLVSLYSATKLFVTYFSQCLHAEYKSEGITVQCVAPFMVSTNMIKHRPVNCFIKSAPAFVYEALNTVGYSAFTSGCLSHALQSEALTLLLPSWIQMSTFFIRLLRKTSDVSPWENDKQKVLEKEE